MNIGKPKKLLMNRQNLPINKLTIFIKEKAMLRVAYLLLSFTLIVSCQKKGDDLAKAGLFTKLKESNRGLASLSNDLIEEFRNYQDPKQVYIYCHNKNAKQAKSCYEKHMQSFLEQYKKTNTVNPEYFQKVIVDSTYSNVQKQIDNNVQYIYSITNSSINQLVDTRKDFCQKNAKVRTKKCLTQYIEKDTFTVLNKFQNSNSMNGNEYLFVKKALQKKFKHKLSLAHNEIKRK